MIRSLIARPSRAEHLVAGRGQHVVGVVGEQLRARAYACAATETITKIATRMNVDSDAGEPGRGVGVLGTPR